MTTRSTPWRRIAWTAVEASFAWCLWRLARHPSLSLFSRLIGASVAAALLGSLDLALDRGAAATGLRVSVIALLALSAIVLRGARSRQAVI